MSTRRVQLNESDSPVESLGSFERLTPPSMFDGELLMRAARLERDRAVAGLLVKLGRHVAWLWRKAVAEPFKRWLERERTIRELSSLRARELAELGIAPGMIPYVAAGKVTNERGSPAANENAHPRRAA